MDPQKVKSDFISFIPNLTFESHKGQGGRVGIVGGSKNYTGAPFFAAISALKVGCDLVHVFCTSDSSSVIKSYSPELIVHSVLDNPNFLSEISTLMSGLHSLVIGPGLGRDNAVYSVMHHIVDKAKEKQLPIVFDADSLFYLNTHPELIHSYNKAILTPNKIEFQRLYESVIQKPLDHEVCNKDVEELSKSMGGVTVVRKGPLDIISDGLNTVSCNEEGSPRRCGGQGDLLSGSLGTFNFWVHNSSLNLPYKVTVAAAFASCLLTRRCSYMAFQKFKRSTITTNLIDEIHSAFPSLFNCD